ncbi:hypothetical protein BpHYR1_007095 [Brachionus plicatilis]|uniref:Uncharacterized protein n=1 Tax=Brachionus plicatilis TaxID=10195 RepID=A0A3M7SXJ0_BRAPC|nr:hypothetical protein BpHYR1_007095 [Brachionus plicatilis]
MERDYFSTKIPELLKLRYFTSEMLTDKNSEFESKKKSLDSISTFKIKKKISHLKFVGTYSGDFITPIVTYLMLSGFVNATLCHIHSTIHIQILK